MCPCAGAASADAVLKASRHRMAARMTIRGSVYMGNSSLAMGADGTTAVCQGVAHVRSGDSHHRHACEHQETEDRREDEDTTHRDCSSLRCPRAAHTAHLAPVYQSAQHLPHSTMPAPATARCGHWHGTHT